MVRDDATDPVECHGIGGEHAYVERARFGDKCADAGIENDAAVALTERHWKPVTEVLAELRQVASR